MNKSVLLMAAAVVMVSATACSSSTSSGDKTKTAQAGQPTVAATKAAPPTTAATSAATKVATPTGLVITVAAKDYAFGLDKSTAPAGQISFTATNSGPTNHEFVVFKTDLAPDKLPLVADKSKVDEEGEGLHHIDEIGDLNVGDSKTLTVTLEPGAYVFVCNLPAHYAQGMYVAFTAK